MNKLILILIVVLTLLSTSTYSQELTPRGYVNDFANVLTPQQISDLTERISLYEKQTSIEIAIVTVPNIEGYGDIAEFASELGKKWKVGKAGANNGLFIINSLAERKFRIEVGYGLEAYLPDAKAAMIIKHDAVPNLKNGDYYGAYSNTLSSIQSQLGLMSWDERMQMKKQYEAALAKQKEEVDEVIGTFFMWAFFIAVIVGGIWGIWWIVTMPARKAAVLAEKKRIEDAEKAWQESLRKDREYRRTHPFPVVPVTTSKKKPESSNTSNRKKSSDDSSGLMTGIVVGSMLSHNDYSSHSSDSSFGGSDFGGFGGGGFGGGGASSDY